MYEARGFREPVILNGIDFVSNLNLNYNIKNKLQNNVRIFRQTNVIIGLY